MGNCSTCPSKGSCGKKEDACKIRNNSNNNIKKVIGVMSGKGGVGKSTVSVMIAKMLSEKGYKVGIMDADITGPSVARLLNIDKNEKAFGDEQGQIFPVEKDGIKVISLNLLIEDEEQPVIWRGSLLSGCINQFWQDVIWGELDYLIIDMPPGTSDISLTVMQSIPLNGIIMVSVPQSMISMIVTKSINMAKKLGVNIYGVVQNMSYILCPHCNEKIYIHNQNEIQEIINKNDVKLLAQLPTTKEIGNISNDGFLNICKVTKKEMENVLKEIENK